MRILCLNAWGGKLQSDLVAFLRAEAPDILCLQEVTHSPGSPRDWLTYRDGTHVLDQRADLFADIRAALPDHDGQFCPTARGTLWNGERPVPSFWGLATFTRRGLPLIGQAQGFVHGRYGADGFGSHPRSRNAHGIRVWDHDRDRALCVVHMHGLRDPENGKADTPARMAQAQRMADLVRALVQPGDDTVVCGDFNLLPDSAAFAPLTQLGLTELVTGRGHAGTRTALYEKPGRFADYMLVSPGIAGAGFEVLEQPVVSDHCALRLSIGSGASGE